MIFFPLLTGCCILKFRHSSIGSAIVNLSRRSSCPLSSPFELLSSSVLYFVFFFFSSVGNPLRMPLHHLDVSTTYRIRDACMHYPQVLHVLRVCTRAPETIYKRHRETRGDRWATRLPVVTASDHAENSPTGPTRSLSFIDFAPRIRFETRLLLLMLLTVLQDSRSTAENSLL